jgi:hypothetical protein
MNELLKNGVEGNLEEVERILKKSPELARKKGTITDLSGRIFENFMIFQLASWYLDLEMCEIILKYLDENQAALQWKELENDRKDIHQKYGKHFDFQKIIDRYSKFKNTSWGFDIESKGKEYRDTQIGGAQKEFPAWLIYAVCESGSDTAWTKKDFSRKITREYDKNYLSLWFKGKEYYIHCFSRGKRKEIPEHEWPLNDYMEWYPNMVTEFWEEFDHDSSNMSILKLKREEQRDNFRQKLFGQKSLKQSSLTSINDVGVIKISIAIPYHQLTFGKELGRGSFGIVYKGEYQFGQVAIKTLLHQELKESLIEDFKKEASIMASLRSPFIVSLYGICLEKPHYSIVMEYMANGSLSNFIQSEKPIEWKIRYQIGIDVGGGLAYLHNHEMVHCDLKSLNILLDVNYRARISDFGLSKVKLDTSFSTVSGGSTRWMAPELFEEGAKSTKAADVFAYGVVLWELGSRKFPFATTRNEAVPMLVCRGKREEITKDTPPSMARLIAKCWDGRAESRPKIDEAVKTLQAEQASYKF